MHCKPIAVALLTLLFTTNHVKGQFNALGSWDSDGVPDYLIVPNDEISLDFLEFINVSLPEQTAVPEHNPSLLVDQVAELHIHDSTEIFLTFAHEGAGWLNSLAFYTYTPEDIPTVAPSESELTLIFPNSSYEGSGGGLSSGNKVSLGTFSTDVCIGFALVARGWKSYLEDVTNSTYMLYSDPQFNPEADSTLRQHCITMYDDQTERVVIGFEDIHREWGSCDHDFNDVLFYASASNSSALTSDDYNPLEQEITSCYSTPEDLGVEEVKLYKTTCVWNPVENAEAYRIRFRKWNTTDPWEYRNANSDTSFILGSIIPLKPATYYEWQIATTCDGVQTHNSEKHVFQTLIPCEMPAGLTTLNISSSSATMVWTPVPDIEHYILRFREVGATDWEWRNTGADNFYIAENLANNTSYEWSVNSFCSVVISCFGPYGTHKQFSTAENLAPDQVCEDHSNYRSFKEAQSLGEPLTREAIIADLNKDDIPELIQFNESHTALIVQSFIGTELTEPIEIHLESAFEKFALDDQNADGYADIILLNNQADELSLLSQIPASNFEYSTSTLNFDTEITALAGFTRMNDDVQSHIVYADKLTDEIQIVDLSKNTTEQRGLQLGAVTEYFPGMSSSEIRIEDLNKDHYPDLIVIHDAPELSIVLNRMEADTMPFVRANYTLDAPINQVEILDLNGDRRPDLVYTLKGMAGIWFQQNLGLGDEMFFSNPDLLLPVPEGSIFIAHKANDENRALIATSSSSESEVSVWEFLHSSNIIASDPAYIGAAEGIDHLWLEDINNDEITDLLFSGDTVGLHYALGQPQEMSQTTVLEVSEFDSEISLKATQGEHYDWFIYENDTWVSTDESGYEFNIIDNTLSANSEILSEIASIKCQVSLDICGKRKYSDQFELIRKEPLESTLHVYPNPAREFINVDYSHPKPGKFILSIYRMDGSLQLTQNFTKEPGLFHVQLGISDLNPGPYLLTVTRENDRKTATFTVVR